mgnify:CR=1 FL=1
MFFKRDDKLEKEIASLKTEISNLKALISLNSIGNKGVQTDIRQTHLRQQIDTLTTTPSGLGTTMNASEIVNLVNGFKGSIQKKFKSLTDREFFVFCIIYGLEEQLGAVTYKDISVKTGLSESVIRDYTRGILKKGIDLTIEKHNNKINFFKVSPELKSMVSLESLIIFRNPYQKTEVPFKEI